MVVKHSEVRWFGEIMDDLLTENDHKPGWKGEPMSYLLDRLEQEVEELKAELETRPEPATDEAMGWRDRRIIKEAADIANFCMMIADVQRESARGLSRGDPTQSKPTA